MLLLVGVVLAYLVVCFLLARGYVYPVRFTAPQPPNFCELRFAGASGADRVVWASPGLARGVRTVFVFAHGYGGTRGDWAETMEALSQKGMGSVAIAMPGQDASPDSGVGFGLKESRAIQDTAAWVRQEFGAERVVVVGLSMGGAAAWLAGAEASHLIDAIATEGAFAQLDEAMGSWFDGILPLGSWVLRPVPLFGRMISGIDPASIRPVDAASGWTKPSLVIHGEQDSLIPRRHAERLAQASGAAVWWVPDAAHAQCQVLAPEAYVRRLVELAERVR